VSRHPFRTAHVEDGTWKPVWFRKKHVWTVCWWHALWRCGGSVIWRPPVCIMAHVIGVIARIGATKECFVSDASGSWIGCVARAIELTVFTASLFARVLLDGIFPCAFPMCQGKRGCSRAGGFPVMVCEMEGETLFISSIGSAPGIV
jgi:hypothetical protein